MKRTCLLALAIVAFGVVPVRAQDVLTADPELPTTRAGTRGAAFLHLGVGARARALAGAYAATAEDVSALYWNSAGIAALEGFSAGFSYSALYEDLDIGHTFAGAVLPIGLTRIGVSVNTLNSGDMPWTNESFPNGGFQNADGSEGDMDPQRTDFDWTAMSVGLHLARPITDRLNVGGGLKYVQEGIQNADASYFGIDLGTIFRTGLYGVTLGASLQNVGSKGRFRGKELITKVNTQNSETQTDFNRIVEFESRTQELQLPTTFRFSVMTDLFGEANSLIAPNPDQALRVMVDLTDAIDTDLQPALGVEYGFRNMAFLRAGKRWLNEAQIEREFSDGAAIGAGLRLPISSLGHVALDYAYNAMGDLENVQVFSIELRF